jgi:hypothetical protein
LFCLYFTKINESKVVKRSHATGLAGVAGISGVGGNWLGATCKTGIAGPAYFWWIILAITISHFARTSKAMPDLVNHRIVLAFRPLGEPQYENFRLVQGAVEEPGHGEVLPGTICLSLDPYVRGRISDAKSYAQQVPIGGVMEGCAVSQVLVKVSEPSAN